MSVVFVMKFKKKRKFYVEYLYYYYIKVIIWKIKGSIEYEVFLFFKFYCKYYIYILFFNLCLIFILVVK